ncbi:MAG: integration host factor subunit beta [Paludibacter sp.]|nr:integration host factor subunit beta [Paludibacter sp.]
MTKVEVATNISVKTGISFDDAVKFVNAFMEVVKDSVKSREPVYLRGFGSFGIKRRAPKTARNISKGTSLLIPAKDIPFFKPSHEFKKSLL